VKPTADRGVTNLSVNNFNDFLAFLWCLFCLTYSVVLCSFAVIVTGKKGVLQDQHSNKAVSECALR